jgi:ADP-heptose:LPS heptosyltransferase
VAHNPISRFFFSKRRYEYKRLLVLVASVQYKSASDDMVLRMRDTILRLLFHTLRLRRPRIPPSSPVFLILEYRIPLGCCVHGTPIYAALKAKHPDCKIVVATRGLGHAVLQHDPHIDHLISTPDPGNSLLDLHSHAKQLREQLRILSLIPTHILQDASNRRGTLALFAALLHLAPTSGFADIPQLYDLHLDYDAQRSMIDNNLRLAGPNTPHVEPAVYFTSADLAAARSLLEEANPEGLPVIAFVVQGSGDQPNNWLDHRFAALIRHVESVDYCTVFLGTQTEAAAIDRLRTLAASSGHSFAGRTTIPQLAALLCLCDALITVDTGTLHVGRAAQVPTLVLAPTWQPAIEWLPLSVPNAIILRGSDISTIPSKYQLDEITIDAAVNAFTQLTAAFPPSAAAREQRAARLLSNTRA